MLPSHVRSQFAGLVAVVIGIAAAFVFNGVSYALGGPPRIGVDPWSTFVVALQVSLVITVFTGLITWATGTGNVAGRVVVGALGGVLAYLVAVYLAANPGFAWFSVAICALYGAICGGGYHVGKRLSDNA